MAINFGLAEPVADPMEVLKSYGMGRQFAQQEGVNNAYAALAANPNDQSALMQLGQWDGKAAYGIQADRQAAQAKQAEISDEDLVKAAAQVAGTAKDEAHFEGAIDYYIAHGFPQAARYRGQWANREAIMAQGGFKPQQEPVSGLQRDTEYIESQIPGGGKRFIENRLDPMIPVTEYQQDGSAVMRYVPRSQLTGQGQPQQQGPQPGAVEDGYRFRGGDPADQNNWEKVGGASQQGSHTFPG